MVLLLSKKHRNYKLLNFIIICFKIVYLNKVALINFFHLIGCQIYILFILQIICTRHTSYNIKTDLHKNYLVDNSNNILKLCICKFTVTATATRNSNGNKKNLMNLTKLLRRKIWLVLSYLWMTVIIDQ